MIEFARDARTGGQLRALTNQFLIGESDERDKLDLASTVSLTVSCQMLIPRSNGRTSTFRRDNGNRTYTSITSRINSGEELNSETTKLACGRAACPPPYAKIAHMNSLQTRSMSESLGPGRFSSRSLRRSELHGHRRALRKTLA